MDPQTKSGAQPSQVAPFEAPDDGLEKRLARLESKVAAIQEALGEFLSPFRHSAVRNGGYAWIEPPALLKNVTDYSQLDPEDLVHIHELTDEDVRRRLDELEQWYGISSDTFYRRWQQGEADDIFEKIEWVALYEDWLRIKNEYPRSDQGTQ